MKDVIHVLVLRGVSYASNLRRVSLIEILDYKPFLLYVQTPKAASRVVEVSGCYLSDAFLLKFSKTLYKPNLDIWILQTRYWKPNNDTQDLYLRTFLSIFYNYTHFSSLFPVPRSRCLKSLVGFHTYYKVFKFVELASFFNVCILILIILFCCESYLVSNNASRGGTCFLTINCFLRIMNPKCCDTRF